MQLKNDSCGKCGDDAGEGKDASGDGSTEKNATPLHLEHHSMSMRPMRVSSVCGCV